MNVQMSPAIAAVQSSLESFTEDNLFVSSKAKTKVPEKDLGAAPNMPPITNTGRYADEIENRSVDLMNNVPLADDSERVSSPMRVDQYVISSPRDARTQPTSSAKSAIPGPLPKPSVTPRPYALLPTPRDGSAQISLSASSSSSSTRSEESHSS
jgi:hypothetical protein